MYERRLLLWNAKQWPFERVCVKMFEDPARENGGYRAHVVNGSWGCGVHYLALASAWPGVGRSEVVQEREGEREGGRDGTWDNVADRKLVSCRQVGVAVGVAADDVSDDPLQWLGDMLSSVGRVLSTLIIILSSSPGTRSSAGGGARSHDHIHYKSQT